MPFQRQDVRLQCGRLPVFRRRDVEMEDAYPFAQNPFYRDVVRIGAIAEHLFYKSRPGDSFARFIPILRAPGIGAPQANLQVAAEPYMPGKGWNPPHAGHGVGQHVYDLAGYDMAIGGVSSMC